VVSEMWDHEFQPFRHDYSIIGYLSYDKFHWGNM